MASGRLLRLPAIAQAIFASFSQSSASGQIASHTAECEREALSESDGEAKSIEAKGDVTLQGDTIRVILSNEIRWSKLQSGCVDPSLCASLHGRAEPFVDGFGLCSPGNWSQPNRWQHS